MTNINLHLRYFCITIALALCGAWADVDTVTVDTLAAAPLPVADTIAADTAAVLGQEPAPPAASISYTGAWLSAVIPGAGQIYHKKYVMGAGFFAADVIAGAYSLNRWNYWIELRDEFIRLRDSSGIIRWNGTEYGGSRDSIAGVYSVLADQTEFEARQTRYTAYNAFAWTVGLYYYNIMDALERGGVTAQGKEKSPATAGLLAAIPFLGLGQLYNGHPGKSGMMAMTQAALAATAINHHRLMRHASGKYNEMRDSTSAQFAYRDEHLYYWKSRYDQAFSQRNTYLWISLAAYLYGIFDAVVDAHLSDYAERMRFGPDLSIGSDGEKVSLDLTVGF